MAETDINAPIDESFEDRDDFYIPPRNPNRDIVIFIIILIFISFLIYKL